SLLCPAPAPALLAPVEPWSNPRSGRSLAKLLPPNARVVSFEAFHTSLPFYLGRPLPLLSRTAGELTSNYICAQRDRFVDEATLAPPPALKALLASSEPVYVLIKPSRL